MIKIFLLVSVIWMLQGCNRGADSVLVYPKLNVIEKYSQCISLKFDGQLNDSDSAVYEGSFFIKNNCDMPISFYPTKATLEGRGTVCDLYLIDNTNQEIKIESGSKKKLFSRFKFRNIHPETGFWKLDSHTFSNSFQVKKGVFEGNLTDIQTDMYHNNSMLPQKTVSTDRFKKLDQMFNITRLWECGEYQEMYRIFSVSRKSEYKMIIVMVSADSLTLSYERYNNVIRYRKEKTFPIDTKIKQIQNSLLDRFWRTAYHSLPTEGVAYIFEGMKNGKYRIMESYSSSINDPHFALISMIKKIEKMAIMN